MERTSRSTVYGRVCDPLRVEIQTERALRLGEGGVAQASVPQLPRRRRCKIKMRAPKVTRATTDATVAPMIMAVRVARVDKSACPEPPAVGKTPRDETEEMEEREEAEGAS